MRKRYLVLWVLGVALLFGVAFWIFDGVLYYLYFPDHLRFMTFEKPGTVLDAVALAVPSYALLVRTFFLVFCVIGGGVAAIFFIRQQQIKEALAESQELYHKLISASPDAISVTDETGIVTFVSPRTVEMFGCDSSDEITGTYAADWVAQAERAEAVANMRLIMQGVSTRYRTYTLSKKDGSPFAGEISSVSLRDASGKTRGVISLIRDATEREKIQEALRQSEEHLRLVLENMPVLLDAFDEKNRIIVWNRECERVTGYSAEEIIDNPDPLSTLYPDEACREQIVANAIDTGFNYRNIEWELRCKDGSTRTIAWSNLSSEFPIPGWYSWAVGVDVTERVRAEETLRESEMRYRDLLNATFEGIIIHDRGRVLDVNRMLEQMFGYTLAELGQIPVWDLVIEEDRELITRNALSTSKNLYEVTGRRKDGTTLYIEIASKMHIYKGRQVRVAAVRDITENKIAQLALQQYADRLKALHEIDTAILSARLPGEIVQAAIRHIRKLIDCQRVSVALFDHDAGLATILGAEANGQTALATGKSILLEAYSPDSAVWQQEIHIVQDIDAMPDKATTHRQLLREGIHAFLNVPLVAQNQLIGSLNLGTAQPNSFTQDHLEIAREVANQLAIALHQAHLNEEIQRHADQLEQRVAERTAELQHANERLKILSHAKDEFVSNVSHELLTPIASLRLYHDLLKRAPHKTATYLEHLQRETVRLERIVDDLLYLSRLDQGRVAMKQTTIDLNEMASQFVTDRAPLAESRGLHLTFHGAADLPPVQADEGLWSQTLSVLVTNAFNYTPPGGSVEVRTHTHQENGQCWVGLSVSDTGPGIPPEDKPHLFKRFFRGQASHDSGAPGTGLGLAIVKEIVDRHNGRVEVESEGVAGQGATFTVWLPVERHRPCPPTA
jgi:PAS domain S-box-containing protein